jgi:hypothetical protein
MHASQNSAGKHGTSATHTYLVRRLLKHHAAGRRLVPHDPDVRVVPQQLAQLDSMQMQILPKPAGVRDWDGTVVDYALVVARLLLVVARASLVVARASQVRLLEHE